MFPIFIEKKIIIWYDMELSRVERYIMVSTILIVCIFQTDSAYYK